MPTFASPKIIFTEEDRSAFSPNLVTSVGALVVRAKRGPVDPTFVSNVTRYKELFTVDGSFESDVLEHYAVSSFLSKEGAGAYIVRAVGSGALYAGANVVVDGATSSSGSLTSGLSDPENDYTWESEDALLVVAENPGAWGNNVSISITNNTTNNTFQLQVYYKGSLVETFTCSLSEGAKDGWGNSLYAENVVNGNSDYIKVYVNPNVTASLPEEVSGLALGGGDDGSAVSDTDVAGAWDVIANPEKYDVNLLIQGGIGGVDASTKIISITGNRKDCFGLLDAPLTETTVTGLIDYRDTTLAADTSYASLFAPWIILYDYDNDQKVEVPPSGVVAGLLAQVDYYYYPWYSPAGMKRGAISALGLTAYFSEADQDQLSPKGINIFRRFPGQYVLWDDKTLQVETSATSFLYVRRGLIKIRKELTQLAKGFMFEPLTEDTRRTFAGAVEDYMRTVKAANGVYDYYVKCDTLGDPNGNNPPANVDNGILTCEIFLKPVRAIRGIALKAIITRTGVSFEEVGGVAF